MTNCTQKTFSFPSLKRRKIEAGFSGGDITSDGGVLLLRQMDERLGLLKSVDQMLPDPRHPEFIVHSQLSMLKQRVYGLCLGYEDLNDHTQLRTDPAIQTAVNRGEVLASQSTLCRLENRSDQQAMIELHKVFLDQFIASVKLPPAKPGAYWVSASKAP